MTYHIIEQQKEKNKNNLKIIINQKLFRIFKIEYRCNNE